MRRALLVLGAILALVLGGAAAFSLAADTTASCTQSPVVTDTDTTQSFTIECSVPKPAAVTETVTVPGPTVTETVTPKPSATVTPSSTPTATPTVTPTPTATATPTVPPTTGFPDASTTGVPAGVTLTKVPSQKTSGPGWSWRGNGENCIHVETAGAVLNALDVSGCIEVYAANATISNTRITAAGDGWGIGVRGVSGVTVKDVDISGGGQRLEVGIKDVTGSSEITIQRVDIADYSSGVQMSRGLLADSYIHNPGFKSGDHTNGFTHNGGRRDGSMTIRHNTILNSLGQTDAVSLFEDFGVTNNVTVDNNLLAGGSYTLYAAGGVAKYPSTNIQIINNQFSTRYLAKSGSFGPACCWDKDPSNGWSGNKWADGPNAGQQIPAP